MIRTDGYDSLVEPGPVTRELGKAAARRLAERWLDAYGEGRRGARTKAYLWHVFSWERYPYLSGESAREQYKLQRASSYLILSNRRDMGYETSVLPQACHLCDFLVFPENMAWTMAFTHEDGWLGPYFARHKNYAALDAANQAATRKAADEEAARKMGWYMPK